MCLALSVFSTMPDFEEQATLILYYIVSNNIYFYVYQKKIVFIKRNSLIL